MKVTFRSDGDPEMDPPPRRRRVRKRRAVDPVEAEHLEALNLAVQSETVLLIWYANPNTLHDHHWRVVQPILFVQGPQHQLALCWEYAPANDYRTFYLVHLHAVVPTEGPTAFSSRRIFEPTRPSTYPESQDYAKNRAHPFDLRHRKVRDLVAFYLERMIPPHTDPEVVPDIFGPSPLPRVDPDDREPLHQSEGAPEPPSVVDRIGRAWAATAPVRNHPYTIPVVAAASITSAVIGAVLWLLL